MGFRDSGGVGGGSLVVAIRSDNSQPAIFATFAALQAYTATTEGITDAARINVSDINRARESFVVGTLLDDAFTGVPTNYVRVNNTWVLAISPLTGLPGEDGEVASLEAISVGHIPYKLQDGTFGDSGMEVDSVTGRLKTSRGLQVPPGTIYIGEDTEIGRAHV